MQILRLAPPWGSVTRDKTPRSRGQTGLSVMKKRTVTIIVRLFFITIPVDIRTIKAVKHKEW